MFYHLGGFVAIKGEFSDGAGHLYTLLKKGDFGVSLFFVISGFVIGLPFARAAVGSGIAPSLGNYFKRRMARLEPPYLINLLLLFALLVLSGLYAADELITNLAASAVYSHNVIYGQPSLVNVVAWSLEVELQFYLVAPLLVGVFRIRPTWLRRGLMITAIFGFAFLREGGITATPRLALSLLGQLHYFVSGFLLLDIYLHEWKGGPRQQLAWDIVGLAGWTTVLWLLYWNGLLRTLLPFAVILAYAGAFRGSLSNWFFGRRFIYTVGGMCYTIYLYHFLFVSFAGNPVLGVVPKSWPYWASFALVAAIVLPVTLIACALMFSILERPFMVRGWPSMLVRKLKVLRTRSDAAVIKRA